MPTPTSLVPSTVSTPANLKPGEEVYTLGDNLVTVGITRVPSPDPQYIVLELTGRMIQNDGSDMPDPVELPAHRHSVQLAALADGTSPDQVVTDLKAVGFARWPEYLAGLNAFSAIPMRTPEGVASAATVGK